MAIYPVSERIKDGDDDRSTPGSDPQENPNPYFEFFQILVKTLWTYGTLTRRSLILDYISHWISGIRRGIKDGDDD